MPNNSSEKRIYLSVNEAAEAFGISPFTIRKLFSKGKIPGKKVGGTILIPREYIENYDKTEGE